MTLYTRQECGLCRDAKELLRKLQQVIRFEVELVDIDADPAVYGGYSDRVPVVVVDGREVAAAPLDERRLRLALSR